jgi:hypothetical protein
MALFSAAIRHHVTRDTVDGRLTVINGAQPDRAACLYPIIQLAFKRRVRTSPHDFRHGVPLMNYRRLAWLVPPVALLAAVAYAHNAICDCFENGDNTITCEGGFSDGGKAVGVPLRVLDAAGKVLIEGAMSAHSDFTFPKPKVDYRVVFDGGEGHVVTIDGRDIAK